jgi:acetyltransferase-like isoleucine patch superfamily enzyme
MTLRGAYSSSFDLRAKLRGTYLSRLLGGCGRGLIAEKGVRIRSLERVRFGTNCWLKENVLIDGRCHDGFGIDAGDDVIVRAGAYLDAYGGPGFISIGNRVGIGQYAYIGGNGGVRIGDDVMISGHTYIVSATHQFQPDTCAYQDQGETRLGVDIAANVWIAANCVVIDGVSVGEGSVVAAGSVVTTDVPPWVVVAGSPAKVIRGVDEPSRRREQTTGPPRKHDQSAVLYLGRTRRSRYYE